MAYVQCHITRQFMLEKALGRGLHIWSQQGQSPALYRFAAPWWLNLLCGYATHNEQLALSGLFIQGIAWLWGIIWLLLPIFKIPANSRAAVFFIFLTVSVLILLTMAIWQAINIILKKVLRGCLENSL